MEHSAGEIMTIGVTGGTGFIGHYVTTELLSRGYNVVVMDRYRRHDIYSEHLDRGVSFFLGDVTDEHAVAEFAAHVDGIIHLAGILGTQETINHPARVVRTNVFGGLNVLEGLTRYNLPGVYIVVGNWWMNNPYSISKNMIERFCYMYNSYRGARVNVVRGMNAYGPRQAAAAPFGPSAVRKIAPAFVCRALSGMPIEVYGDGEQISDMIYVEDVAMALVNAFEAAKIGKVFGEAIEIGPREHLRVIDTARGVVRAAVEIGREEVPIKHLPMRPGETPGSSVKADTSTLEKIGVDADKLISFEDGIMRTVKWYSESEGTFWRRPSQ